MGLSRAPLFFLTALSLIAWRPQIAAANAELPKSFAVFIVSSNESGEVRGGVAGTAFFISPHRAITAHHVLQKKSFELQPGFSSQRVWLVHEGESAIELNLRQAKFDAKNDLTSIAIENSVSTKYVYPIGSEVRAGSEAATEGFIAETKGPTLARIDSGIEIIDVPRLECKNLSGRVVAAARIDLRAPDVILEATPCLQVNYEPVRGISGGPLLIDGRVVGVNSFGDPQQRHRTWAVLLANATP
jgi:hypothetical protein